MAPKRTEPKIKRPAIMFYTADWLSDQAVRKCSLAARGAWIDMLCMMDKDDDYQVEGSVLVLSRMIGCSPDELLPAIVELVDNDACEFVGDLDALHVTDSHAHVTLTSRRLRRERKAKSGSALRQRKKRAKDAESRKSHGPSSCSASCATTVLEDHGVARKRKTYWQIVKAVEDGTITHGVRNGVALRALLGTDGKGVVLDAQDGHSIPIRLYSPKAMEDIEWLPAPTRSEGDV